MGARAKKNTHIVGIDEAGRGPLAGPVAVGAVCIRAEYALVIKKLFKDAKDSKQMTKTAREACFVRMEKCKKEGMMDFAVCFSSASVIDKKGIVPAIRSALERALRRVVPMSYGVHVLLDGGLRAPAEFTQTTIIRGDETELAISLASITAKVLRDRMMVRYAKKYPNYGFSHHKGYGTKRHYAMIAKFGLSPLHRKSFLHGMCRD